MGPGWFLQTTLSHTFRYLLFWIALHASPQARKALWNLIISGHEIPVLLYAVGMQEYGDAGFRATWAVRIAAAEAEGIVVRRCFPVD